MGRIGPVRARLDVLASGDLIRADVADANRREAMTVPAPEPMPVPQPEPVPEPVPGPGQEPPTPQPSRQPPGPEPIPQPPTSTSRRLFVHPIR